jgi:ParB/RepB/Spo0J family partition protein
MPREDIDLDLIDDNPYNPRLHYKQNEVYELADSIKIHGQLETPKARRKDGRVQLAFGGKRRRAFQVLYKRDPDTNGIFSKQPLDIEDLTDEQMFFFAMEENDKRSGNTPLEKARAIDHYLTLFPDMTEEEVGAKVGIKSQGTVSNMRRVLKLPQLFLDKIDEGIINFTIARELLVLNDFENGKDLMSDALSQVNTTGTKSGYNVKPATVEGIQAAIHSVCLNHLKPLEKTSWRMDDNPLFDTTECMKCAKLIITHPSRGATSHFCKDSRNLRGSAVCWEQKQHAAIEVTAAAARAKMRDDVLTKFAPPVPETPAEPPAIPQGISETIEVNQEFLNTAVAKSYSTGSLQGKTPKIRNPFTYNGRRWVCTFLSKVGPNATAAFCYRICKEEEAGKEKVFRKAVGEDEDGTRRQFFLIEPKVLFSVAPKLADETAPTGGDLVHALHTGDKAKVDELTGKTDLPHEKAGKKSTPTKAVPGSTGANYGDEWTVKERMKGVAAGVPEGVRLSIDVPDTECHGCNLATESHCPDGQFQVPGTNEILKVCLKDYRAWEKRRPQEITTIVEAIPEAHAQIKVTKVPHDVLALAKEKAGTRADVLDLKDVTVGPTDYTHQFKQGYADLAGWRDKMDHPEECESCTTGFHFAFNSQAQRVDGEPVVYNICSNPDCLAKKKGTFTRAKNAEGLARKNAERKAIKTVLDAVAPAEGPAQYGVAVLKLVILAQIKGCHVSNYAYHQEKLPKKWFWDKLNVGTEEAKRTDEAFCKIVDELTLSELVRLLTEFCFYSLQDHNTDTGMYQVKTELPLSWFGIDIAREAAKEAVSESPTGNSAP